MSYQPPAPVEHLPGVTVVCAPRDEPGTDNYAYIRQQLKPKAVHEHQMTKPAAKKIAGGKVIIGLACPEHPEVFQAIDMGTRDAMRMAYARLVKARNKRKKEPHA